MLVRKIAVMMALAGLTACVSTPSLLPDALSPSFCDNALAEIRIDHPTANISACEAASDEKLRFAIRPENVPINDSAWYGFRVDPKTAGQLLVDMHYENGKHRYPPKISYDGENWTVLPETALTERDKAHVQLSLRLDKRPFYISAQEIFSKTAHDRWTEKIASRADTVKSTIGASKDGHPIYMLEVRSEPDVKKPYVMWVGRQHPPEVTGALALIPFTEAVLAETELAKTFLSKYNLLIVPNMNPDGVTAGHWRHNKAGIDLNRDWGPFTQPETQAVKSALGRFENGTDELALFLDFHSTWRNLFYTQIDEEPTKPEMFAHRWLSASDARISDEDYEFTREPRAMSERAISKNYIYKQFGIAAITYEVGDREEREDIKMASPIFAEEMMRIMNAEAE